jgi:magnesium chelatase subunit I
VAFALQVEGLDKAVQKIAPNKGSAEYAAAVEFILEGLHLNKRLNKDKVAGRVQYRG